MNGHEKELQSKLEKALRLLAIAEELVEHRDDCDIHYQEKGYYCSCDLPKWLRAMKELKDE